jgi:hypothetical protein
MIDESGWLSRQAISRIQPTFQPNRRFFTAFQKNRSCKSAILADIMKIGYTVIECPKPYAENVARLPNHLISFAGDVGCL